MSLQHVIFTALMVIVITSSVNAIVDDELIEKEKLVEELKAETRKSLEENQILKGSPKMYKPDKWKVEETIELTAPKKEYRQETEGTLHMGGKRSINEQNLEINGIDKQERPKKSTSEENKHDTREDKTYVEYEVEDFHSLGINQRVNENKEVREVPKVAKPKQDMETLKPNGKEKQKNVDVNKNIYTKKEGNLSTENHKADDLKADEVSTEDSYSLEDLVHQDMEKEQARNASLFIEEKRINELKRRMDVKRHKSQNLKNLEGIDKRRVGKPKSKEDKDNIDGLKSNESKETSQERKESNAQSEKNNTDQIHKENIQQPRSLEQKQDMNEIETMLFLYELVLSTFMEDFKGDQGIVGNFESRRCPSDKKCQGWGNQERCYGQCVLPNSPPLIPDYEDK